MSAQYKLTQTDQGLYSFTTDAGIAYTAFFIECPLQDKDGNEHIAYSFGFDRSGKFDLKKFSQSYDVKIKNTIVYIIEEFFKKNGEKALLYLCYPEDEYARHRSIIFAKWHKENLSDKIEHIKKYTTYNKETLYGGMLILKENPFIQLLIDAIDSYINDIADQK